MANLLTLVLVYLVLAAIFYGGFRFFMWLKEKRQERQEQEETSNEHN